MKTIAIYILSLIVLVSCSQEINENVEREQLMNVNDSIQPDSNTIVLIPLEDTPLRRGDRINASLTTEDYSQIDSLVERQIEKYNKDQKSKLFKLRDHNPDIKYDKDDFLIDWPNYARQYVAYKNKNGDLEVWINCFCAIPNSEWKEAVLIVSDGGNCFFNLTVNLTKGTVKDF